MKLNDRSHQTGAQTVASIVNTLLWSVLMVFPFIQVRVYHSVQVEPVHTRTRTRTHTHTHHMIFE